MNSNRVLIASNRLPFSITKNNGELRVESSVGGLATGIGSIYKSQESLWIGWPGYNSQKFNSEETKQIQEILSKEKCLPVFLTAYEIKQYYNGFCNNTIWPIFHYFNLYSKYEQTYWNTYKKVNQKFCDAIVDVAENQDSIWIHDYHLMLLPDMVRKQLPRAKIGFFLHIPFPSYEIFRLLPWRAEILRGILGADLVGFHTYDYVRHFVSTTRRILGYDYSLSEIQMGERSVKVDLFPMGIDYDHFRRSAKSDPVKKEVQRIRKRVGTQKIILSFDRLDYTKGIPRRLEAFDAFLSKKPGYKGKITLFLVTVPSRNNVQQYQVLKKQVDELVGRINGKYATTDWLPIRYFSHFLPQSMLVAMYSIADVGLVTPLRDGMNLMAKEFIASKVDCKGVLILSEMAGSAQELGEAIIVNPYNQEELIDAIEKALNLPLEEQITQNHVMQKRIKRYDTYRWAQDFINSLDKAWISQSRRLDQILNSSTEREIIQKYATSKNRLILLDFDGTLVPFDEDPEKVKPTREVLAVLRRLTEDKSNDVIIISGRKHKTLLEFFDQLDIGLIGEHGAWIKERSGKIFTPQNISTEWKKDIIPLLEIYVDRTPGSFIEEKDYSLVWHYRKVNPSLGFLRANQIKDDLINLTTNLGLVVEEGNKIIEVKSAIINKGRAIQARALKNNWDFILAIGDDKTDEDLFKVLPTSAFSIRVGLGQTSAHLQLSSQIQVIPFLNKCLENIDKVNKPAKDKDKTVKMLTE